MSDLFQAIAEPTSVPISKGKSFTALDTASHEGQTNTWFTPRELIEVLGPFDLDPCTQSFRPFNTASNHVCEDKGDCGLSAKWDGRVWLNPPYGSKIARWLSKLADHGNGIALVFTRTETAWAQSLIARADGVNFMAGRISFLRMDGKPSSNAGTGSMLIAFGAENVQAIKRIPGVMFDRSNAQVNATGKIL
jgi:DNA N-6-adenine-methyltransferase Dam